MEIDSGLRPVLADAASAADDDVDDDDDDSSEMEMEPTVYTVDDSDSEPGDENSNTNNYDQQSSVALHHVLPTPFVDASSLQVEHSTAAAAQAESTESRVVNQLIFAPVAENALIVPPVSQLDDSSCCFKTTKRKKTLETKQLVVSSKDDDVEDAEVFVECNQLIDQQIMQSSIQSIN